MKPLVGARSVLRFCLFSPIYVGLAWVLFMDGPDPLLRLALAVITFIAAANAVTFWWLARRWRIDGDCAYVPIWRDRGRWMSTEALATVSLFDGGVVRFTHLPDGDDSLDGGQLAINLFVSTRDLKDWLDIARQQAS